MKAEPAKDLQERIKEESKAYSGSVMEDEYNPLRKYTSDDLIEEIEYAFEQGANFILEEWEEAERYNMNNMKTVEEKIISHIEQNCTYPDGSPMMDEQTFYEGAKCGYNEAMRCQSNPKIKQLEWEDTDMWYFKSKTSLGLGYSITEIKGTYIVHFGDAPISWEKSFESAKSAAQADFERRVRECLDL